MTPYIEKFVLHALSSLYLTCFLEPGVSCSPLLHIPGAVQQRSRAEAVTAGRPACDTSIP